MAAEFLSATILLILVIDPFGNVPLVAAALAATQAERRARRCCSRSCSAGTRFSS
jgi:small neutral amino acid transporter SnatA (MarC family)